MQTLDYIARERHPAPYALNRGLFADIEPSRSERETDGNRVIVAMKILCRLP